VRRNTFLALVVGLVLGSASELVTSERCSPRTVEMPTLAEKFQTGTWTQATAAVALAVSRRDTGGLADQLRRRPGRGVVEQKERR
jgi:hypothetical protein